MEQTAVEWIQHKMATSTPKDIVNNINDWFNQAKAIEKEQIKAALQEFLDITLPDEVCEKYYNETFKSE